MVKVRRNSFQCTIMRGGTSKGIFLMEDELPMDPGQRDRTLLAIFGSPDMRQIDGMGGADPLTSKVAIIASSKEPGRDIDYTFGAVGIAEPIVDYSANCGNISSAVGPYAIDQGLIQPEEPITTVKIFNTNTRKMIYAKVPIGKGEVISEGDFTIDGVPGSGAKIELSFMDPGGTVTKRLIPTGNVVDEIVIDPGETFVSTIIDAGSPTVITRAKDLGLVGTELPEHLDQDLTRRTRIETIRKKVGELIGIPPNPSIPKIVFVTHPQDFKTSDLKEIRKNKVDVVARTMSMGRMHKAFPITTGISIAVAAVMPGSIIYEMIGERPGEVISRKIRIGHPSGKFEVEVRGCQDGDRIHIESCTIGRTARKIMEGRVYIPKGVLD